MRRGEPLCASFPGSRFPGPSLIRTQSPALKTVSPRRIRTRKLLASREHDREARHERQEARHERQREAATQREAGKPMPDSAEQLPPLIRRQEVVAIALVGLLAIAVVAVLYFAKAFFLPVSWPSWSAPCCRRSASFLERYRIPRGVGAVLIVVAVAALGTFIVGLIAAPAMEWSSRLPELAAKMKDKLHIFDRPLALWQELSDHARRLRRARRRCRCRNSNGCSRRWNSCRRPSPNSCCSSPRCCCSSRAGRICAAR